LGNAAVEILRCDVGLLWPPAIRWLLTLFREARQQIIDEVLRKQQPDGGWVMESLGPFGTHPEAPVSRGSNSYATALAAFVLEEAGEPACDRKIVRATDWLKSHQDVQSGAWPAASMNHNYEAGSMESQFMRDAATGFAVLALTCGQSRSERLRVTGR